MSAIVAHVLRLRSVLYAFVSIFVSVGATLTFGVNAWAQSASPKATHLASNGAAARIRPVPDFVAPAQRSMAQKFFAHMGNVPEYSWHLSVINGGYAGTARLTTDSATKSTDNRTDGFAIDANKLKQIHWTFVQRLDEPDVRQHAVFGMAGSVPMTGDFNGDGKTDLAVFYRGQWFIDMNGNGKWDRDDLWARLGEDGDQPVAGDWDGDGKADIGIFGRAWRGDHELAACDPGLPDAQNRTQFDPPRAMQLLQKQGSDDSRRRVLKLTATGDLRQHGISHVFFYGSEGHKPVAGDFNGDGICTVGVFRQGRFLLDTNGDGRWSAEDVLTEVGTAGALPVIGDFDGDGIDDIGIYRRGTWQLDTNGDHHLDDRDPIIKLGGPDDLPVVGDWDGDGKDEIGVFHASNAEGEEL